MSENILEKIIKKKIEKIDFLKKTIDVKSLDEIINKILQKFYALVEWTHNTSLAAPNLYSK